jgi:hypothetical protein
VNSAANGNITFTNNGAGWVQINSASATSPAQLKLQNTAATSVPCQVELFMNKTAAGTANDNIANLFFYGKDVAGNKVEYARLQSTIRDPTTNSTNGSIQIRLADNMTTGGTTTEYWRWNGADGQNESFKAIDMNTNDVLNIGRVSLTNPTPSAGLNGQSLVSGGTGFGAYWNYKMTGTNNGVQTSISVTDIAFTDILGNIPIPLTTGSFMISPINKYKVSVCGNIIGVNDILELYLAVGNLATVVPCQTFNGSGSPPQYFYVNNMSHAGGFYTSYNITDTVNMSSAPFAFGGTANIYCYCRCVSGSHTITSNAFNVSIEPVYV